MGGGEKKGHKNLARKQGNYQEEPHGTERRRNSGKKRVRKSPQRKEQKLKKPEKTQGINRTRGGKGVRSRKRFTRKSYLLPAVK